MKRLVLLAATALVACSSEQPIQKYDQTQTQKPVTPTGTLYLRAFDMSTYSSLVGADVKVIGAEAVGQTDANGVFKLEKAVVASTYTFLVSKAGYLTQRATMSLSSSTGNSPLGDPIQTTTVNMYKADGEIRGALFFPDGRPVSGATLLIDQNYDTSSTLEAKPLVTQSGADGTFKFTELATRPSGQNHTVFALWFDENADGNADYGTISSGVSTYPGAPARVFMTYNTVGQRVVNTNIADGELPPGEDIQFTFAMPCLTTNLNQAQSNAYVLTNNTRNTTVNLDATWTGNTQLALKPAAGALREGERYTIALNLTTAGQAGGGSTGTTFSSSYQFQLRGSTISPITDQVTNVSVTNNNPGTGQTPNTFDFNTNNFKVQWDGVSKAVNYYVYAKDTSLNPNYVQVAGPISFVGASTQRYVTTVSLPIWFTPAGSQSYNYPLSYNNKVTFAVVGQDIYGNLAPLSGATPITVSDNWAPQANSGVTLLFPANNTDVDAINDEGAATNIVFRVTYNEPMDPTVKPELLFPSGASANFVWDNFYASSFTGTVTVTIPPGTDAVGAFIIRGGKDMAGNLLSTADLTGYMGGKKELMNVGGFEDGSGGCSMTSWTGTHSVSMPDPIAVPNNARTGKCALQLGVPVNGTAASGLSTIKQNITLNPSAPSTSTWYYQASYAYRGSHAYSAAGNVSVSQSCRFENPTGGLLYTLFTASNNNSFSYYANSVDLGKTTTAAPAGSDYFGNLTQVTLVCEVNNPSTTVGTMTAMYIDDMSLKLVKPRSGTQNAFGPP